MRIPRIYTTSPLAHQTHAELEASVAHYVGKVLRMSTGRELIVFNGQGGEYTATIQTLTKKSITVSLDTFNPQNRDSSLQTHLAIGLSRGERWDLVLQKATELGVTHITPLWTENCEVKLSGERLEKKMQHWQGIIISACEQCQRNTVPTLNAPKSFAAFIQGEHSELNLVLHHRSDKNLHSHAKPTSCTLLIGPEGGLSANEITQAQQHTFEPLTLGPRVLRTETAPLAALSIMQFAWGDF